MGRYILHTYSPGWKAVDITKDPEYQKLLEAQKAGTLHLLNPGVEYRVAKEARNYHTSDMLVSDYNTGEVKQELVVMEVPKFLEDGSLNSKGTVILANAADVIYIMNCLRGTGDCELDQWGDQLTEKEKKALLPPPANLTNKSSFERKKS